MSYRLYDIIIALTDLGFGVACNLRMASGSDVGLCGISEVRNFRQLSKQPSTLHNTSQHSFLVPTLYSRAYFSCNIYYRMEIAMIHLCQFNCPL